MATMEEGISSQPIGEPPHQERQTQLLEVGEVVLIVGEKQKNRGEWKKGVVLKHIRGEDGLVPGLSLRHKGQIIERPFTLVCPLEIKGSAVTDAAPTAETQELRRSTRRAAQDARVRLQLLSQDED